MYEQVIARLQQYNAEYRVLEHPPEGQCDKISAIRGNAIHEGAKALLLRLALTKKSSKYVLVVLPADMAVDFGLVAQACGPLFGNKPIMMAPVEKVRELTGCEIGAVPPFSFNPNIGVIIDNSLVDDNQQVAFNASRLDRSVIMKAEDYKRIMIAEGARFLKFAVFKNS